MRSPLFRVAVLLVVTTPAPAQEQRGTEATAVARLDRRPPGPDPAPPLFDGLVRFDETLAIAPTDARGPQPVVLDVELNALGDPDIGLREQRLDRRR